MEAADLVAGAAALAHEKTVVDLAVASASNTAKTWSSGSPNPVDDIDTAILSVLKGGKMGSGVKLYVVFGATAWKIFKNSSAVASKFVVGAAAKSGGVAYAIPTESGSSSLFIGNPEVNTSLMVYDAAQEGVAESMQFVLDSKILIFANSIQPNRMDSSFMKTFRLRNRFMVPRRWTSESGRVEFQGFDWSEDVQLTNAAAGALLTIS
jgi:hypothetical protein